MGIITILSILFFHGLFDFKFQKEEDALNKSHSFRHLLNHTITYSICWMALGTLVSFLYFAWDVPPVNWCYAVIVFSLITFIAHTTTDFFTSKITSYLWEKKETHYFFVMIYVDQMLHFIQLFLTYKFVVGLLK